MRMEKKYCDAVFVLLLSDSVDRSCITEQPDFEPLKESIKPQYSRTAEPRLNVKEMLVTSAVACDNEEDCDECEEDSPADVGPAGGGRKFPRIWRDTLFDLAVLRALEHHVN